MENRLSNAELLQLRRFNTPAVYNGWEQITRHDRRTQINLEEITDYTPGLGVMAGYAVTVVCEPSNPEHQRAHPDAPSRYREYLANIPGPKIVVVQDLDKPHCVGAFWGEVNASTHKALGCVGTIIDGAIRDLDEMTGVGFKALARRLCVGHAYSWPVRWGVDVEVFGCTIRPGQLIHADKHGFLAVPKEDEAGLLEATRFMDGNECNTVIEAGLDVVGRSRQDLLKGFDRAAGEFNAAAKGRYGRGGEW